ncbi:hypothetical protein AGMMS49982_01940 [Bacteroidia bacterium]|nr:hypothetical protein AGMMS49982_01940 [Bacteroidia bacterium]
MSNYLTEENIIYQLANLRQITFEVTDACNLKCTYCGYGEFYNDHDKREETVFAFQKLMRKKRDTLACVISS